MRLYEISQVAEFVRISAEALLSTCYLIKILAEREGFEPSKGF